MAPELPGAGLKGLEVESKLLAWIGFPAAPHRIQGSRSWVKLALGLLALALLFLIGASMLASFFAFDRSGRGLLVDSALAVGLGEPLAEATVTLGACDYRAARAGSRLPGQWTCRATVVAAGRASELIFETVDRSRSMEPRGAGRLLGQVGVYWPLSFLAARWWNALGLILIGGGLVATSLSLLPAASGARRLWRARRGEVRGVDLLTWKGRPSFAYSDEKGRLRFQRAPRPLLPLTLDGVRTRGAALVSGRSAILLEANLLPLEIEEPRRGELLDRLAQVQQRGRMRPLLPPQPGDPPTLESRIDRIERSLAGSPGRRQLCRLYDEAWRLIWDSKDAAVADRALEARDVIAHRLGPAATLAALRRCRSRQGASSD